MGCFEKYNIYNISGIAKRFITRRNMNQYLLLFFEDFQRAIPLNKVA